MKYWKGRWMNLSMRLLLKRESWPSRTSWLQKMNKTLCANINQLIAQATAKLEKADIVNPMLESELLLSYLLSLSRFDLYFKEIEFSNELIDKFDKLLE